MNRKKEKIEKRGSKIVGKEKLQTLKEECEEKWEDIKGMEGKWDTGRGEQNKRRLGDKWTD